MAERACYCLLFSIYESDLFSNFVFEGNKSKEDVKGYFFFSPPEILGLRKKQNYLFHIQMIVLCLLNPNERYQNSYVAPAV